VSRALLLLALACHAEPPPPEVPDVVILGPEDVVEVVRGTLGIGPRVSGRLEAAEQATLRAEVAGPVRRLTVDVGDPVVAGQVLVQIEAPASVEAVRSAQRAVASAREDLASAERDLDRMRRLYAGGAVAKHDVEVAGTTVEARRAALASAVSQRATASQQAGHTVVTSPLTGRVATVPVDEGDVVTVGQELLTVLDPSSLRLEAGVPTRVVGEVVVGTKVKFDVQGVPGTAFEGSITRIGASLDPATGLLPVLVEVPNPTGRLPAGLFAEGRLELARRPGLIVPFAAVERAATPVTVKRVENGRVDVLDVRIVAEDERAELAEISGPVEPGDRLLVGAVRERLPDGAAVEIASGSPTTGG
jgi:RND family efflux transporter MFP subunit